MTSVLGPVPCITCGRSVWWDRVGGQLRLMERRGVRQATRHVCEQRCGAWMPIAKERCARFAGHGLGHKTRYALDNATLNHVRRVA